MAHEHIHSDIHTDANDPMDVTNPEHAQHHIVTPFQYMLVFGTLLVGTAITVAAAEFNFGILNPIIALGIASTKAVIVILFFMHVKYQSNLIKMTVGAGFQRLEPVLGQGIGAEHDHRDRRRFPPRSLLSAQ